MYRRIECKWPKEQIASALRLAGAGVPVVEVARMMGTTPGMVSGWKEEYSSLFDRLVRKSAEQLDNTTGCVRIKRMAYLSGCTAGEEVESELRACKLRYSVIENVTAVARELLRSGNVLANLQRPVYSEDASSPCLRPAAGSSPIDRESANFLILVNAQLSQTNGSASETMLSGAVKGQIDELRWRTFVGNNVKLDEPILQDIAIEFSLDAVLDTWMDAIRAFYTSSMDALLLGHVLIQKSGIQ